MNMRLWTGFLISFLCVSVVFFAYLARKPLCIDSKLVERIDRVGESSPVSVYRCGLKKHVPYDGKFAAISDKLSLRLQRLEKFLEWIGPLKTKIFVTVFENRPEVYKVYGREVYLSDKILQSPGQLEKAILKIWFREKAHESLADQALVEESLTDFLLWQMNGEITLQDPLTLIGLDTSAEASWPRVLQTTQSYCQNPWRLPSDLEACAKLAKTPNEESKRISLYSLRPLMTQVMIQAYQKMPVSEQIKVLKHFGAYIAQTQFQGTFASLDNEASSFLQNWIKSMKQENLKIEDHGTRPLKQWSYLIENQMTERGFSPEDKASFIEYLVWDESGNEQVPQQVRDQMKDLKVSGRLATVGYIQDPSIWILPNEQGIDLKVLLPIRSTKGILVRCGLPETSELLSFQDKTQRLLWVEACDRKQAVNFASYFKNGAESFARNNKEISFIEFHLPSLKMAVERSPNLRLAQNFLIQNNIEQMNANHGTEKTSATEQMSASLGWKKPLYVESVQAYRAQSAVEAIDWFRIKTPTRGL